MSTVTVDRDGGLAVVTFDPPPLNLYTEELERDLITAIDELEREPARAVLFRAEGRIVSGGVDVERVRRPARRRRRGGDCSTRLVEIAVRIDALPCPTVFAAHALCLTWAFEVALACDLILAAESASFGLVERVVGLTPAMGGTQRLAERAGTGRAKELVMTGVRYGAATLEPWNVVNRVLPDEGFDAAARAFAAELAAGPTRAHAATKQVIRDFREGGVDLANARIGRVAGDLFDTEDLRGAVRSFLSEGPGRARFSGR